MRQVPRLSPVFAAEKKQKKIMNLGLSGWIHKLRRNRFRRQREPPARRHGQTCLVYPRSPPGILRSHPGNCAQFLLQLRLGANCPRGIYVTVAAAIAFPGHCRKGARRSLQYGGGSSVVWIDAISCHGYPREDNDH